MSKLFSPENPYAAVAICGYGLQLNKQESGYEPDPNMAVRLWVGEHLAKKIEKTHGSPVKRILCGGDMFGVGPIADYYERFMLERITAPKEHIYKVRDSLDTVGDVNGALAIEPNLVIVTNSWHQVASQLANQRDVDCIGIEDYIKADTRIDDTLLGIVDRPPTNPLGKASQIVGTVAIKMGKEGLYQWLAAQTRPVRAEISLHRAYQLPSV